MNGSATDGTFFKSIFESSVEGILVVDENGVIKMANTASEDIFGYEKGELYTKNIQDLIPKNYRKSLKLHRQNYNEQPKSRVGDKEIELWGLKKNGTEFPMDISLTLNTFETEPVTVAFLKDTTKRKNKAMLLAESNASLIESNRKYSMLIGNLKGIVFRCHNNRDFTMKFISDGCLSVTGHSPDDFLEGRVQYGKIILPEDKEKVWNNIQQALSEKEHFDIVYRILDKKGNLKYVRETGLGIFNGKGKVTALEGFTVEVTDQKKNEENLVRKEAKNRALLAAIPDMMFIQDLEGNYLDGYANATEKLFMAPAEFIGMNMKKVLPPSVYQKIKASHEQVKKSGKIQLAEYSVQGKEVIEHYEARVVLLNEHALLTIVRDVTQAKAVRDTLHIRNSALQAAGNGIVISDAKQKDIPIIYANDAFYAMTGYKESEVLGQNCRFLQNEDREQEEIALLAHAINSGSACQVTLRNFKKDGTLFYNELTVTPVRTEQGELTHFIGVLNDVSARKREELLKDDIRKILEQIAQHEPLKKISQEIVKTLQASIEGSMVSILLLEPKSKSLRKLVAPDLPEAYNRAIEGSAIDAAAFSYGSAAQLKKPIVVADIAKDPRWIQHSALALENGLRSVWSYPLLSLDSEVLGTFTVYHKTAKRPTKHDSDIIAGLVQLTSIAIERYHIQEALKKGRELLKDYTLELEQKVATRTSELKATVQELVKANLSLEDQVMETKAAEKRALAGQAIFRAISRNFPNGAMVVFNSNHEIVYIDGGALYSLGLDKSKLEGLHIDKLDFFSKKRITGIKKDIEKTLQGEYLSFEMNFRNRSYAVNTSPMLGDSDMVKWTLFVYNDITRQKQAENDIRKALVKEQELNELKSRFISMASHEFRTPLSAINTSAILIGKQNMPGKEEKREKYVHQIQTNVRNLVVILNDFLSLSKLEEGKVAAKPEHFDLIEFSESQVKEIAPTKKYGQQIKLRSEAKTIPVYLDPKLLRHVYSNLLSNAIKYSEDGQEILLSLKKENNTISIAVKDKGIGIPWEDQGNLFQRFFRAGNSTNIQGTGLGLHIVKQYAELMGGTISFNSELDEGTTFVVAFNDSWRRG